MSVAAFVPSGWKLLKQAAGDLNKDGLADAAGIIEGKPAIEGGAGPRVLFIALRQKSGGYRLSVQANRAVLLADEGGVFGDPLAGLRVERGALVLSFFGGSAWRWSALYRFRFQDGGWYLIGATTDSFHLPDEAGTKEDYNLVTGTLIRTVTDDHHKRTTTTVRRGRKQLASLSDFDATDADY